MFGILLSGQCFHSIVTLCLMSPTSINPFFLNYIPDVGKNNNSFFNHIGGEIMEWCAWSRFVFYWIREHFHDIQGTFFSVSSFFQLILLALYTVILFSLSLWVLEVLGSLINLQAHNMSRLPQTFGHVHGTDHPVSWNFLHQVQFSIHWSLSKVLLWSWRKYYASLHQMYSLKMSAQDCTIFHDLKE